jgi:hypothetical protein
LTHCKKVVDRGHHWLLPIKHQVWRRGKHFKGQVDHRTKPMHRSGMQVFDMVKDIVGTYRQGYLLLVYLARGARGYR